MADKLSNLLMKWSQSVRDSEYLLDMRLQNMEDKEKTTEKGGNKAIAKLQEVDEVQPELPVHEGIVVKREEDGTLKEPKVEALEIDIPSSEIAGAENTGQGVRVEDTVGHDNS